jgi:hypothetical protein
VSASTTALAVTADPLAPASSVPPQTDTTTAIIILTVFWTYVWMTTGYLWLVYSDDIADRHNEPSPFSAYRRSHVVIMVMILGPLPWLVVLISMVRYVVQLLMSLKRFAQAFLRDDTSVTSDAPAITATTELPTTDHQPSPQE